MGYRIAARTGIAETVERVETATAALDRVRELTKSGAAEIRVLTDNGRVCSIADLEGLAEFENEADDA